LVDTILRPRDYPNKRAFTGRLRQRHTDGSRFFRLQDADDRPFPQGPVWRQESARLGTTARQTRGESNVFERTRRQRGKRSIGDNNPRSLAPESSGNLAWMANPKWSAYASASA